MMILNRLSAALALLLIVGRAIADTTTESPYTGMLIGDSSEIFHGDDNIAEESIHNEDYFSSFLPPKSVINEGKPFYVAKDPVTGKFDFNAKKTVGIQNDVSDANELIDLKDQDIRRPNDVNTIAPNIHDFLNLPVKYSSHKSVYPLISSSYSNLKYQGNNKQFISNHKNFSTSTTTSPKYYTSAATNKRQNQTSTTVKAHSYRPTAAATTTTSRTTTTTPATTTTVRTTRAPSSVQTTAPASVTTTAKTTVRTQYTRFPYKSTTKNKYLESSDNRKKYQTTTELPQPTTTAYQKETNQLNAVIFEDELKQRNDTNRVAFPSAPTRRVSTTSRQTTTTAAPIAAATTTKPLYQKKTESILRQPSPFVPAPNSSGFKPLSPPQQTNSHMQVPPKAPESNKKDVNDMTLSELFNTIAGEESVAEQNTVAYGGSKSTMEFVTMRPSIGSSSHVNLEDYDDMSNQYVQYEIQPPNMNNMHQQYKPVSSMNNIVISPDQNSASFVLGSQQSVGSSVGGGGGSAGQFMTAHVAVEPPFRGGGYSSGTVIDESKVVVEKKPTPPLFSSSSSGTMKVEQPQNVLTASVRFPDDAELKTHSFDDAPIVKGTIKKDDVPASPNGHSAPVALAQNQLVVFPPSEKMGGIDVVNADLGTSDFKEVKNRIVFESDNSVSDNTPHQQHVAPQQQLTSALHQQQPQMQPQQQQHQQQLPQTMQFSMKQDFENSIKANGQNLPQLAENLTPPNYFQKEPMNRVAYDQTGQRPMIRQPVAAPHSQPPFMYNELSRKPYNGPAPPRQYLERPLPNILPQFRPNTSKMGQGPPPPPHSNNYAKNDGPSRGPQYPPNHMAQRPPPQKYHPQMDQKFVGSELNPSVGPPPPPAAHQIRRTPLPNRFISRINNGPPGSVEMGNNRRYYRVPPPGAQPPQIMDRVYMKQGPPGRMPPPPPRGYYPKPRHPIVNGEPKVDDRQTHFLDYELNHSPPPARTTARPIEPPNSVKLEPVVTLQMLQSKKLLGSNELGSKLNLPTSQNPENHLTLQQQQQQQQQILSGVEAGSDKNPVYVVYPVKNSQQEMNVVPTDSANAIVVGQRGEAAPLPPSKISQISPGTEYQNTPFTVVSHFEQEPILMAKTKPVRTNFPYHLEKPNANGKLPEFNTNKHDFKSSSQYNKEYAFNTGEEPVQKDNSYQISSTLKRVTEKPIAIAYTPTEPNHNYYYQQKPHFDDKFSMPNYDSAVISEIREDTQTESSLYNHDDTKYHNYEDNFQAPFHASINLGGSEKISNSYEGWSIVTPSAGAPLQQQDLNKIDRSDDNVSDEGHLEASSDKTKNSFESTQFQPEYLSGFKPIYPNGKDQGAEFGNSNNTSVESRTASSAAALTGDESLTAGSDRKSSSMGTSAAASSSSSSTASSASTTTMSPIPVSSSTPASTKKIEIDSLEAFFDEFTKDYTDDEESSTTTTSQ